MAEGKSYLEHNSNIIPPTIEQLQLCHQVKIYFFSVWISISRLDGITICICGFFLQQFILYFIFKKCFVKKALIRLL